MSRKSIFCVILAITLILSLPFVAFADGSITLGSVTMGEIDVIPGKSNEKMAYGMAPDNILPFVYKGVDPAEFLDIDTSACMIGKLYIFNMDNKEVTQIEIGNEVLECYAASQDYLFCVTGDGKIIKTDYVGSFSEIVYTSAPNTIDRPAVFGGYLSFIEGGSSIVIINTATKEAETVLPGHTISSMFMFDDDKIIWRDETGMPNYYNLTLGKNIVLGTEYEVNCIIAPYISQETGTEENEMSINSSANFDPNANDVSFPLPNYPAEPGTGFKPDVILSRFTTSYAGSNQCDGFAKYAHDCFVHLVDTSRSGPSWVANSNTNADYHGSLQFESPEIVKSFFESLTKGAFIRYVSKTDTTPENGTHSIVFDKIEAGGLGVRVYECNQDDANGVGYQYYTYRAICDQYKSALYYVNHNFSTQKVFDNANYHKHNCINCAGYLRQPHTSKQSVIATKQKHTTSYSCCGGSLLLSHTAAKKTAATSTAKHRVYYSCCSGHVMEAHTFSSGKCTVCGYIKGGSIMEPENV